MSCTALCGAVFLFPRLLFAVPIDPGLDPVIEQAARLKPLGGGGLAALSGFVVVCAALLAYARFRRSEWATRAGLCGLALGLALLGLEGGLRLCQNQWALPIKVRANCYASNPRGYFVMQSMAGRPDSRAFCVDGFESDWQDCASFTAERDLGRLRVLALGDSFTNGVGVFSKDRWPKALERLLAASPVFARMPKPVVTNCGYVSLDTERIADRYFEMSPRHAPQLVIYAFVLNDVPLRWPEEARVRPSEVDFQPEDRASYFLRLSKDPLLGLFSEDSALWRLLAERWLKARVARETEKMYVETYEAINRPAIESSLTLIEAMKRDAESKGARFLVAVYPLFYHLDAYPFAQAHALLRAELDARGIANLDLLESFVGQDAAEFQVHPTDFHPNERAHAKVAERLYTELARRGWLLP